MVQEGALVPVAEGGNDSGQLWPQRGRASESRRKPGGSASDGLGVNGVFIIGERDQFLSLNLLEQERSHKLQYGYPLSIFSLN
jgi:hypothetical protein